MTTLNDTINAFESTFQNAVAKAEAAKDTAVAKAEAKLAEAKASAEKARAAELKTTAEKFFADGGTLDQFTEAYGKSGVTTRNHLKAVGVAIPAGKKGKRSKVAEDEQKAIAQDWKTATTQERLDMAAKLGITDATMRQWAIKHDVYTPVKRETADA